MPDQPTVQINNAQSQDHDLLIQIATKLDRAILDINELKDNTTQRVTDLEEEKVNQREFTEFKTSAEDALDKQAKKLDRVYTWGLMGLGALGVIEFALQIYSNYFHQ